MIKKILVVGGAGYIGGCVVDSLIKKKIPFTVYDNLTYENHYFKPVDFVFGDVRDYRKLKKLLPDYNHIIWLAAIVGDGACAIKPELTKAVNQNPLVWLARHYQGRIIFTSTCSVYGVNAHPVTETSSLNPLSVYAQTKLGAEQALLKGKANALIFRLGTAYGIGDEHSRIRMDLVVNYMTFNALKDKKLIVFRGGQYRPFIHVKDVGQIIVDNLEANHSGVFNLATQNLKIIEVAKIIQAKTGCKIIIKTKIFTTERSYYADITKAIKAKIISLKTKYRSIEDGVDEMIKLILSNRVKNIKNEFYSNQRYLIQTLEQYEKILNNFSSDFYVK